MMEWILMNKELIKLVYAIIVVFICSVISMKTDRLFKISDYQGFRYLRNSFLFYGVAFMLRFIFARIINPAPYLGELYYQTVEILFGIFIMMAGFFLFYSLVWKRVEKEINFHSIFNIKIGILFAVSLIVVIVNFVIPGNILLYSFQVILFLFMCIISLLNKIGGKYRYHFMIILLGLIGWTFNFVSYIFTDVFAFKIIASSLNMLFFILFLYMISKIEKK